MPPPTFKYEISRLETSDHTDGRVHFHGLLVTVSVIPRCISSLWLGILTSDTILVHRIQGCYNQNFVEMSVLVL